LEELAQAVNHMVISLENQENLRKQLTVDVAHELRTPLTALSSHLEAMIEGIWEPTPIRLTSCYEEIARIAGLVADLEQLAKVESDNLKLIKTPVELLEVLQQVSASFESQSKKKGVHVTVEGEPLLVFADRDRIYQVVVNLLSNAIKYTGEGGHITISIKEGEGQGTIQIEDDGIGIPEEDLELIFERFYRTDKSRNRKTGGAGIGLAIAKSIVVAHGGVIEATSKDGEGSCFTVVLPKE
jgi:signal transduction histidine kinase